MFVNVLNLKDPKGNKNSLTDGVISELARNIASQKLSPIALEHLGFDFDDIEDLKVRYRSDTWEYNAHILTNWRDRNINNNITVSFMLLQRIFGTRSKTLKDQGYARFAEFWVIE